MNRTLAKTLPLALRLKKAEFSLYQFPCSPVRSRFDVGPNIDWIRSHGSDRSEEVCEDLLRGLAGSVLSGDGLAS